MPIAHPRAIYSGVAFSLTIFMYILSQTRRNFVFKLISTPANQIDLNYNMTSFVPDFKFESLFLSLFAEKMQVSGVCSLFFEDEIFKVETVSSDLSLFDGVVNDIVDRINGTVRQLHPARITGVRMGGTVVVDGEYTHAAAFAGF